MSVQCFCGRLEARYLVRGSARVARNSSLTHSDDH